MRGMAQASRDLIEAMHAIAEAAHPITGRGIGYKLFTAGLIPSMDTKPMRRVYRLLKEAREQEIIPLKWIVDETRNIEDAPASWADPDEYIEAVARSYRRDHWKQQPVRIEAWSEKGTVRGVLKPILDKYGVGFRVLHGFSGATPIHAVAQDDDGRPLIVLYCGDYDPSGLCMSEHDLPTRLEKYGGHHVELRRIALVRDDLDGLPSFRASEKKADPRFKWFVRNFGRRCWELDAMDPNDLRERVEEAISDEIDWEEWERCSKCERAESESLRHVLDRWRGQ
jgi:hypothetical protein